MKNKLRIIGGDWRSRQLSFVDAPGLRPTPARVRETVFNWLQYEIFGKQCLDLYAGSGALGFEAASRGAKSVVQVESNAQACRSLKDNAIALSADDRIKIVQSDVLRYLEGEATAFDVVFLDPPFGLSLVIQTCRLLEGNGWLAKHAKIYVETERHFDFSGMPENWRQLKSKSAGEVGYHLFERIE
ncbi:16S rRNA (guanine(966)-N(2))-methyltransferase RsmD [Methylobacter tundripaludum]|uniref:16S rRNA (guanine(966)-N(2))-methyltransferase RsmD n=1 Tax=Methylobacter tundripaludum TaxID=173365 RepID=UPI00048828F7|nr:16S rRNA (guanine(966)-N(2))-methyltransferase RsmD [Methylobacter tundripaludum]